MSLWIYTASLGLFILGLAFAGNSFLNILLPTQLGFSDQSRISSFINVVIPLGGAIGGISGGVLAGIGRRKAIIVLDVIIAIGVGISLIKSFPAILVGRFIFGIGGGALLVICPKFVNEICPMKIVGPVGSINQIQIVSGMLTVYLVSLPLPFQGESTFSTTGYWRVIYALPLIPVAFQAIIFLTVLRDDSPAFYESKGDFLKAK